MSRSRARRVSLLIRAQSRAFHRWQACPAAWGGPAFRRYLAASDLLDRVLAHIATD